MDHRFADGRNRESDQSRKLCKKCQRYFNSFSWRARRRIERVITRVFGDEHIFRAGRIRIPLPQIHQTASHGSIDDLRARKECSFCDFLLNFILTELRICDYVEDEVEDPTCLIRPSRTDPGVYCVKYDKILYFGAAVRLQKGKYPSSHSRQSPPFETPGGNSVSIAMLQRWIQACEMPQNTEFINNSFFHSKCHTTLHDKDSHLKIMLIDVQNRCLVAANSGFRYSVLSYVWGNDISFLRTTRANVGSLHNEQALSREAGVPTLIDDAIEFMKALGEKYLWVDSLCLVQDDAEKKYAGIRHMHTVFARAYLTIVAASAKDANAPLAGFRSGTRDPLSSLEIGGKRLEKIEGNPFNEMHRSVYSSRAWTLQEFMMSTRCLVFTYDQVYYRCASALVAETRPCEPRSCVETPSPTLFLDCRQFRMFEDYNTIRDVTKSKVTADNDRIRGSPVTRHYQRLFPSFQIYANLVGLYTQRDMSYQSDILNAFSALQTALSGSMGTDFEFGLPLAAFGFSLLWTPNTDEPSRREIDNLDNFSQAQLLLPTWSWIGWDCSIAWLEPLRPRYLWNPVTSHIFEELVPTRKLRLIDAEVPWNSKHSSPQEDCAADTPILYLRSGTLRFTAETVPAARFSYRRSLDPEFLEDTSVWRAANLEVVPLEQTQSLAQAKSGPAPPINPAFPPRTSSESLRKTEGDDGLGRGFTCGLELEMMQNDADLEFVALSTFQPYEDESGNLPKPFYHFNAGVGDEQTDLPFLNCLVIKWFGNVAERVGIAQVGALAWKDAWPTVKTILLR